LILDRDQTNPHGIEVFPKIILEIDIRVAVGTFTIELFYVVRTQSQREWPTALLVLFQNLERLLVLKSRVFGDIVQRR
jgi:hypothetical protein